MNPKNISIEHKFYFDFVSKVLEAARFFFFEWPDDGDCCPLALFRINTDNRPHENLAKLVKTRGRGSN